MLDGEGEFEGGGGSAGAEDTSVHFTLDLESDESIDRSAAIPDEAPPPSAAPTSSAPPAAAPVDSRYSDLLSRMESAERRAIAAESAVSPWLTHMAQLANGQQAGPRRPTREQLLQDPNVTVQDLLSYIEGTQGEVRTQAQQMAQLEARRGASEQFARGLLTADAMGSPEDTFDSLRERYVRPLYESQPYMRDVIHAMFPDQPSMGEVAVAWVRRIAEAAQNDPVATYRRLGEFVRGGAPAAARQVSAAINQAAQRGAHKVSPGGGNRMSNAEARGLRSVNGREIWQLSDSEFDKLDSQLTGGL